MAKALKELDSIYFMLIDYVEVDVITPPKLFHKGTLWKMIEFNDNPTLLECTPTTTEARVPKNCVSDEKLKDLKITEFELLLAVERTEDRFRIVEDVNWLQEGSDLKVGDDVMVIDMPGLPSNTYGVIQYKGYLEKFGDGIYFGVELNTEYYGMGASSGSFRQVNYFTCNPNCGFFLNISKVRKKPDHSLTGSYNFRSNESHGSHNAPSVSALDIRLDERVVWWSDDQGPQTGIVKWLGRLQELDPNEDYAGIAFDNPIGKGTGRFKGKQLFETKRNHASLVPIVGLMKESDYDPGDVSVDSGITRSEPSHQSSSAPDLVVSSQGTQASGDDLDSQASLTQDLTAESVPSTIDSQCSGYNFKSNQDADFRHGSLKSSDGPAANLHSHSLTESEEDDVNVPTGIQFGDRVEVLDPLREGIVRMLPPFTEEEEVDEDLTTGIQIGDRVEVLVPPRHGIVRFLEPLDPNAENSQLIAGLEMDTEDPDCYTDGHFRNRVAFQCPPNRAFFIPALKCRKIPIDQRSAETGSDNPAENQP